MAEPLVPSSSSSLSRGWTFRAIHSQNPELTLEICAPEKINVVTFCSSAMMGALLDHSIWWVYQVWVEEWDRWGSLLMGLSVRLSSYWPVLVWGYGGNVRGLLLAWAAVAGRGVSHIPYIPPGWFKTDAGVGHSLAMWPQPWHLKHWREWVSAAGCTLPLTLGQ